MIAIVDYGMGNLGSIKNMLWKIGHTSVITSDPGDLAAAEKLILPGVGAFDRAMENLESRRLIDPLNQEVIEKRKPILGICLGMQLFGQRSEEGVRPGLGWIEAESVRFAFDPEADLRLPHMGWNRIQPQAHQHPLVQDLPEDPRFYFVHSFHVRCARSENVLATASYGFDFHAAIHRDNIWGAQFHPEKSHKYGMRWLRNFAEHS